MNDFTCDASQSYVEAGMAVGQPLVIHAEDVQDRGVQVVHVNRVYDCSVADFVG